MKKDTEQGRDMTNETSVEEAVKGVMVVCFTL